MKNLLLGIFIVGLLSAISLAEEEENPPDLGLQDVLEQVNADILNALEINALADIEAVGYETSLAENGINYKVDIQVRDPANPEIEFNAVAEVLLHQPENRAELLSISQVA